MSCKPRLLILAAVVGALAGAGAASAQPLDIRLPDRSDAAAPMIPLGPAGAPAARPVADLANPLDPQAPTKLQANPLDTAVFAKTAVDRRFGARGDLSGSVGFLCGLQPGHGDSGAAAAYGVDPHGRFVGAKFSIAFR
jgi:hypothetical protein